MEDLRWDSAYFSSQRMRIVAICARVAVACGSRLAVPLASATPLIRPLATAQFRASFAQSETLAASGKAESLSSLAASAPA